MIHVKIDDVAGSAFEGTTQLGSVIFQTERNNNFLHEIFVRILNKKNNIC